MKKLILFSLFLMLVSNTFAQQTAPTETPAPEAKMGRKMKPAGQNSGGGLKAALGLNDDQNAKLKAIQNDFKGKMMAIKSDKSIEKSQKKTQVLDATKKHDADIQAILTPEQATKWTELKSKRREQMKGKMKDRKGKKGNLKEDDSEMPDEQN